MPDRFATTQPSLSGPASSGFAVVPSDSIDLPETTRAIYVGTAGDIALRMLTGETLTLANVQPGSLFPLRVTRVLATGTTATGIAGLV